MSQKESALKNGAQRRTLPTDRIAFSKQLDILRAWAAASGPGGKSVYNADVAKLVKMAGSTISLANPFFTDVGLLLRVDGGMVPSPEVSSFNHAYQWNADTAAFKLAPVIERTWFAEALIPSLTMGQIAEGEAIATLSESGGAGKDYADQLHTLLEYMQAAGMIVLDGGFVRRVRTGADFAATSAAATTTTITPNPNANSEQSAGDGREQFAPRHSPVSTAFFKPAEGMVNFHVSFKVDMTEMGGWSADRISAFFAGVAQVLNAKGSIEEKAASG
jgi:hypothetical protein